MQVGVWEGAELQHSLLTAPPQCFQVAHARETLADGWNAAPRGRSDIRSVSVLPWPWLATSLVLGFLPASLGSPGAPRPGSPDAPGPGSPPHNLGGCSFAVRSDVGYPNILGNEDAVGNGWDPSDSKWKPVLWQHTHFLAHESSDLERAFWVGFSFCTTVLVDEYVLQSSCKTPPSTE